MSQTISQSNQRRKFRLGSLLGATIIIFALIGLVTVIIGSIKATSYILDNAGEKAKFEKIIQPVLMLDPPTFDSPANADKLFLLQSSIWATLYSDKKSTFTLDDMNMVVVPASDVDVEAAKLYGPDVKLEHQSFSDFEINYIYDESIKSYKIPASIQLNFYTAEVESIKKDGDLYILEVGYVPPGNTWSMDMEGNTYEPTPQKYMIYELKKVNDSFQIMAIKDIQTTTVQ